MTKDKTQLCLRTSTCLTITQPCSKSFKVISEASMFQSLLYVITNRSFHSRRTVPDHGALTFLPLTWPSTVILPRTSCRDDSVVFCRSVVSLRPSCIERRSETNLLSAVVLAYGSGCRAANVVQRRCCALPSFSPSGLLLRP